MRNNSKARISGLAANTHARNRTLPDLPFAWPWEIWVRDYDWPKKGGKGHKLLLYVNKGSQFSLPTGLWTSAWKPPTTLEFVPSAASHTIPFFSVHNLTVAQWPTTVTAKKKKRLAAKRKISKQTEKPHGKKKKTRGKKKNLTAKRKTSRQKEKESRQQEKSRGKKKNLTAKRKRVAATNLTAKFLIGLKRKGFSFCREVFFLPRVFFLPWGFFFCRKSSPFCREVFLFVVRFCRDSCGPP